MEQRAQDLALASKYKSEFLANMSHELRTPLNSLLILSKDLSLNKSGNLTEKQIEAAKVIHDGGQDLLTLINDILDLSKVEAGKLQVAIEQVDIETFFAGLKTQLEPIAKEKGLDFSIDISDGVNKFVETDEQRLSQIIKNLYFNAIKFTERGGVTIKITKPKQTLNLENEELLSKGVAFNVIDTGIGIPLEKQREIFEAFQQGDGSTNRSYGGTGLGLAISRAMAELLGGELTLESEPGKGSSFILVLPLSCANESGEKLSEVVVKEVVKPVESPSEPNLKIEQQDTHGKKIIEEDAKPKEFLADDRNEITKGDKVLLVIEDDVSSAKSLMQIAKDKGYRCLCAGDGHSGLVMAKTYQPSAIILDLGLPDVDGLQVLEQLKFDLSTRHIPIHIISGREESPEFKQKGAIGYLMKPAEEAGLKTVFEKIESVISSEVKKVLVIEDDLSSQVAIERLIDSDKVKFDKAFTGEEARKKIQEGEYDCIILDLNLPDMTGQDLLKQLKSDDVSLPPVVVYTGKELSKDEHEELQRYAASIVVKGAESPERLLDEISLFLHSVEEDLPEEQKEVIRMLHDADNALKDKKVLLVDDDVRNVFALSSTLEDFGLDVLVASNGKIAIDKLNSAGEIDLVIMDIMMPVMDGYEAMTTIRKNDKYKDLPIIALTAKAMTGDRDKCIKAGASDYITKPVDVDRLISMMKVWLFK
jgi:CheY-like chemotaxis protein